MAQIDDSFKAAFHRITCPDGATLGNYHLGLLADEAVTLVKNHLAICPHCTREIVQLEAFLAETAVSFQPSTAERIKIWIAKRVPTAGQSSAGLGTPAFAMRGGDTGPLMYEAGDAQLSLEVQDDPDNPGRKSILGLILGIETENLEVRLLREEVAELTVAIDPSGNFRLVNLATGSYELTVTGPDIEIHLPKLTI